ncbi:YlzJ-like family protein [Paenibacillus sp. MMO-58]|uniref:YlzJ-like family protein n=1 Tax=Paenibacillus sp. MMO-58 TaxID=3081290 RepID=UPI003016DF0F
MTLYTIMPLENVLDGIHGEPESYQEVWVNGVFMQVSPVAPGMGKIVRLIHCGLDDYLKPELAPGNFVMFGQPPVS